MVFIEGVVSFLVSIHGKYIVEAEREGAVKAVGDLIEGT